MIRTAITIALVPQARQGPFVFHGDLAGSIAKAAALGFDAVEIFPPAGDALDVADVRRMTGDANLRVAAVGTGAGFLIHKLTLTDPDDAARGRAVDFVKRTIDAARQLGAPAIIGSMQGRHADGDRDAALDRLAESLAALAAHPRPPGVPLLYEPLNRYETNLFTRQADAATFLRARGLAAAGVKILADLFHMNIEEADVAQALRDVGPGLLGHVHFVDSNRQAPGRGHTNFAPIVTALLEMKYAGYASAECFPVPASDAAAQQTIGAYRRLFA